MTRVIRVNLKFKSKCQGQSNTFPLIHRGWGKVTKQNRKKNKTNQNNRNKNNNIISWDFRWVIKLLIVWSYIDVVWVFVCSFVRSFIRIACEANARCARRKWLRYACFKLNSVINLIISLYHIYWIASHTKFTHINNAISIWIIRMSHSCSFAFIRTATALAAAALFRFPIEFQFLLSHLSFFASFTLKLQTRFGLPKAHHPISNESHVKYHWNR